MPVRILTLALTFVLGLHTLAFAAGRIVGKVVDLETSDPVEGAQVMLMPVPAPGSAPQLMLPLTARSDAQGTFRFDAVAAGRYRVQATKPGMATVIDTSADAVFAVADGETTTARDLTVRRGGVITGRVVDAHGNGMPELMVMVEPTSRDRAPAMAMPAQTNDLGEFRLAGVAPGEFYVIAGPRPMPFAGNAGPVGTHSTYYPGTTDRARAVPISVSAGQTTTGIDIVGQTGALFSVSGVVVDGSGAALSDVTVSLAPDGGRAGSIAVARANPDGSFTLTGVQPGSYRLMSTRMITTAGANGTQTIALGAFPGSKPPTVTPLTVTAADVTGLRIVIQTE